MYRPLLRVQSYQRLRSLPFFLFVSSRVVRQENDEIAHSPGIGIVFPFFYLCLGISVGWKGHIDKARALRGGKATQTNVRGVRSSDKLIKSSKLVPYTFVNKAKMKGMSVRIKARIPMTSLCLQTNTLEADCAAVQQLGLCLYR